MTGTVSKRNGIWMVEYQVSQRISFGTPTTPLQVSMPVHPDDQIGLEVGQHVEFVLVDEFTHPALFYNVSLFDGHTCAKIIK
jgi:hypothetical protein